MQEAMVDVWCAMDATAIIEAIFFWDHKIKPKWHRYSDTIS